jgi:hypothetical protein
MSELKITLDRTTPLLSTPEMFEKKTKQWLVNQREYFCSLVSPTKKRLLYKSSLFFLKANEYI